MPITDLIHHTIDRGDFTMHVFSTGDGPPLIFCHGGLADHRGALFHAGCLASVFRVVAPDLRAAGRSRFAGPVTWDHHRRDLIAILDHFGIDKVIVGGNSAGSGAALRFALDAPDRCAGLVLVAPVHRGQHRGLDAAQRSALTRMHEAAQLSLAEGIEAVLSLYADLPEPIRVGALEMARGFDPASVAATTRLLLHGAQPFDSPMQLGALTMPTVIVRGHDAEHPRELADTYARFIPRTCIVDEPSDLLAACCRVFG